METTTLLHDDEAEKYVIGGLMNNPELYWSVADRIKPQLFSNPKLSRTLKVILSVLKEGQQADVVSVSSYMMAHPDACNPEPWELAEVSSCYIESAFQQHFSILESMYIRRRYSELGFKLMQFGTNPTVSLEDLQKDITSVLDEGAEKKKGVKSLKEANNELRERVNDNYQGTSNTMIPTGIKVIDDKGGLQTGDFDVIAAESSIGKTTLLTCWMENAAKAGIPCMMFSMEMQGYQISARIVSSKAKISSGIIQYKKLSDWQMNELAQALKQTDDLPIYFDDESTISFESIVASIRLNVKRLGIKFVGIDYLQVLSSTGNNSNQEQFLGSVARRLKNLAKELHICIVALSQLSRNINDPKPNLNRVRASGQIVDAADDVCLIWRPSVYGKGYDDYVEVPTSNTAELLFDKSRNKGTFTCIVAFDKETTSFTNYAGVARKAGEIHVESGKKDTQQEDNPFPREEIQQGMLPF